MAFSLKKWVGSMLFSTFMDEYNENMGEIEDEFGLIQNILTTLVESDSNVNGTSIKLADGTLICAGAISVAYSAGITLVGTWTFPHIFHDLTYYVVGSAAMANTSTKRGGTVSWRSRTVNDVEIRVEDQHNNYSSGETLNVHLIAIGRWKE